MFLLLSIPLYIICLYIHLFHPTLSLSIFFSLFVYVASNQDLPNNLIFIFCFISVSFCLSVSLYLYLALHQDLPCPIAYLYLYLRFFSSIFHSVCTSGFDALLVILYLFFSISVFSISVFSISVFLSIFLSPYIFFSIFVPFCL